MTKKTITTTWSKIASDTDNVFIQNSGNTRVYLVWSASVPIEETGFVLDFKDTISSAEMGQSDVYAKVPVNTGELTLNIQ